MVRLLSGCVDDFEIEMHRQGSSRHGVIFINGFLSQGNTCNQDWSEHLASAGYGHDSWYRVHWESSQSSELINPLTGTTAAGPALHWYTALRKAEIHSR
jgi:hypothetical protein